MESPDAGAPVVGLPERVDRRIRLGPFPSARDALKFAGYAATGAVLAPFVDPFAWVLVLVGGFAVSVWRPEGDAVDERAARWILFQFRHWTGGPVRFSGPPSTSLGSVVRLASGRCVTILRTGGTPLAYRPPADLAVLYDRFRELLRSSEGPLVVRSTTVALRVDPVLPEAGACSDPERAARAGYGELVSVLCRRRRSRRVEISLGTGRSGPEGIRRLEERTRSLAEHLTSLGMRPVLLGERSLAEAVRSFGWVPSSEAR
jgi:hypothetical protein